MEKTIKACLEEYSKAGSYPFHMPGHKGGRLGAFSDIAALDITEIAGFDNLHKPAGIIEQAQKKLAELVGASESFFLVNGSTCGLEAAILAVCNPGDTMIVARNCHRSVYSGMILAGVNPVYIEPEIEYHTGLIGGIKPSKLLSCLQKYPNSKAVIITSPTYEGFTSDIEQICRLVHDFDIPLIVDEAHGAHFGYHNAFPKSAVYYGADIVVQSFHKTLPAFTQTAVLHVGGNNIDRNKLKQTLQLVQSSSPSYLLMASLDECVHYLEKDGLQKFEIYANMLFDFRKVMNDLKNITLVDKQCVGKYAIFDVDLGKLCFVLPKGKYSGTDALEYLRQKHKLELEMAGQHHILAMSSIADSLDGFLRLQESIFSMDEMFENQEANTTFSEKEESKQNLSPTVVYNPREAFFAPKQFHLLDESVGKICGEFIIPYPPGIPLLAPGELISADCLERIRSLQQFGISFVACADASLQKIFILN